MDINNIFLQGHISVDDKSKVEAENKDKVVSTEDLDKYNPQSNSFADIVFDATNKGYQDILGESKDLDKLYKYGVAPNSLGENYDKLLSNSQSNWTKAGNALAQTLVSELLLGTVKGISDLFDLIGQATGMSDKDYSNPVSAKLEEWQEQFRNYAAIHTDPEKNITNGGLLDFGWWAGNMPSIISSLTLLIPSTGIVKGISYLGKLGKGGGAFGRISQFTRKSASVVTGAERKLKAARAAREAGNIKEATEAYRSLNKAQRFVNSTSTANATKLFIENGTTAALSRAMENYQEARQTYNDMYADALNYLSNDKNYEAFVAQNKEMLEKAGIDENNKEAIAKHIAGKAADKTFSMDWSNVVFDVIQLYGLRNSWKGLKNAPETATSVRRAQKDFLRYGIKSPEEIEALKKARSFGRKVFDKLDDYQYAFRTGIWSEGSEGIEEAINYIAQQEGMHLGAVMLGDKDHKNFTNRQILDYTKDPELWDAAFWGVLGGVVFQNLGSGFRRIQQKFDKKEEESDAQEEAKNEVKGFFGIEELAENKKRISEIQSRSAKILEFKKQLDRINKKIDIYHSTKDKEVYFNEGEAGVREQEEAKRKLTRELAISLTTNAMNNGNLDMLKACFEDDNVRKAMVEAGVFDVPGKTKEQIDADSKTYVNDILNTINETERMYDEELAAMNSASAYFNGDKRKNNGVEGSIPAEYLQLIALRNLRVRQDIKDIDNELAIFERNIAEVQDYYEKQENSPFDFSTNPRESIRLITIAQEIGKLRAENREIRKKESLSIADQIQINENNATIRQLENQIKDDAELAWATMHSIQMVKDPLSESGYSQTSDPSAVSESFAYRDRIITESLDDEMHSLASIENLEHLDLSQRSLQVLSAANSTHFEKLFENARTTLEEARKEAEMQVEQKTPRLASLYQMATALELKKHFTNALYRRTVEEIEEEVSTMHNTMNAARAKAIIDATDNIKKIYRNYPSFIKEYVRRLLNPSYEGNPESVLSALTENERAIIKESIEILDLTKAYNQGLVTTLDKMFKDLDSKILQGKVGNPTSNIGESEENAGNNQSNIGTQQSKPITSSQQPINSLQSNENGQNSSNNGKIKGRIASSTSEIADTYDNNDGTTTVAYKKPNDLNSPKFYEQEEGVSLMDDNYVIETHPVLKTNTDTVVSKGYIRKKTPEEMNGTVPNSQQEQQAQQSPVQGPQVNQSPIDNNPSTGEQDTDYLPETRMSKEVEIFGNANDTFLAEIIKNPDVDLDALASKIIEEEVINGVDRSIVEKEVNKALRTAKRQQARKRNNAKPSNVQDAVDDIVVNSTIIELPINKNEKEKYEQIKNDAIKSFKDAVDSLITQYTKEYALKSFNGKYYISLERLLRYVNTQTNDSLAAHQIFSALSAYLLDKNQNKYVVIEKDSDINNSSFLGNVLKTQEQRQKELDEDNKIIRIDTRSIFEELDSDEETALNKLIDSLSPNQKLNYEVDGKRIIITTEDGKRIGSLTIPKIDKKTGKRYLELDGWNYDILEVNGVITSTLGLFFNKILDGKTQDSKELISILYELSYNRNLTKEEKNKLLKQFNDNNLIKQAISQGYANEIDAKTGKCINGLIKFIRYRNSIDENGALDSNKFNRHFYKGWLKDILNNWKTTEVLAANPNMNVSVNDTNAGELITLSKDTEEAKKLSLPPNEALAGGVNTEIHKIALTNKNSIGIIDISGLPSIPYRGSTKVSQTGNTYVIIKRPNGRHGIVYAYPVNNTDSKLGEDFKQIRKAIENQVNKLLNDYYNADETNAEEAFNNLKNFLENTFSNSNGYSSLFDNIAYGYNPDKQSITLRLKNSNNVLILYRYNKRANGKSTLAFIGSSSFKIKADNGKEETSGNVKINDSQVKQVFKDIFDDAVTRISFSHFNSDNMHINLKGIASRQNGKFVITVGDQKWEYNSYNEYVLKNNLVKLNTKPNEDGSSNYNYKGTQTQKANRNVKINISNESSSPVEEHPTSTNKSNDIVDITGTSVSKRVEAILNSTSESKGFDIVKTLVGTNSTFTEENLNSLNKLNLLPKKIIFDPKWNDIEENKDKNAAYYIKEDKIVVGKKFMEMLSDPATRTQAIRKLIHEGLHQRLHEKNEKGAYINRGWVRSIDSIFEEFKSNLYDWIKAVEENDTNIINKLIDKFKNAGFDVNDINTLKIHLNHFKQYDFEHQNKYTYEDKVEEFLVESLTSEEFAKFLNMIDAKDYKRRGGRRNLLQQLLDALAKVFGWTIRKGSLYEKEFWTLKNLKLNGVENIQQQQSLNLEEKQIEQKQEEAQKQEEIQKVEEPIIEDEEESDEFGFNQNINLDEENNWSSITEMSNFSTEDNNILHSSITEMSIAENQMKEETQAFLDNFDIKINEIQDYDSEIPLFDEINRVINPRSIEDISEGTGYAVAFMMQHSPLIKELIALKYIEDSANFKGIRRSIRKRGYFTIWDKNTYKRINYQNQLKEIGKDIAIELRNLYQVKPNKEKTNYINKILDLIAEFFSLLNPFNKLQLNVISNNTKAIANSIKLNDTSLIRNSLNKPRSEEIANRVFVEEAFDENPYEDNIIKTLQNYDIALAGGTSIAIEGVLMRPNDNPLHDLDFMADNKTKEDLDKIINDEYPNNSHIRHINHYKSKNRGTETYLVVDRPFYLKGINNSNADISSTKEIIGIYDAKTNELIGNYISSDLNFIEGVQGKFLDFFTGPSEEFFPKYKKEINGREYLISDARNALEAKVDWKRDKDIWDYNNYVSNEKAEQLKEKEKQRDKELIQKIKDSTIIWGHPAIGKTTYIETHPDEFIEWDNEINPKRNEFVRKQIDPEGKMTSDKYKEAKHEYMSNENAHPEYIEFLTKEWNFLKEKAKREHKKIFTSPLPLLRLFPNDFDLVIAMNTRLFLERNQQRGGKLYDSRNWKNAIDNELIKFDKNKLFYTDKYFNEIMLDTNTNNEINSSITELDISPSVDSFIETLPMAQQANFTALVENGEVSVSCQ